MPLATKHDQVVLGLQAQWIHHLDQSDLMRQASDVLKSFQSLGLDAKSGAADTKGSPPQRDDFEEMQKRFLGGQGGTPVSTPAAAHVRGVSSFAFPDTAASPAEPWTSARQRAFSDRSKRLWEAVSTRLRA